MKKIIISIVLSVISGSFIYSMETSSSQDQLDRSLFNATCKNDYESVTTLLGDGANPNATVCDNLTVFVAACKFGVVDILKKFVEHGATVNLPSKTPFFITMKAHHIPAAHYLLSTMDDDALAQHYVYAYTQKESPAEDIMRPYVAQRKAYRSMINTVCDCCSTNILQQQKDLNKDTLDHFKDYFKQKHLTFCLRHACDINKGIDINKIKILLKMGAKPNATWPHSLGLSSIHIACDNGLTDVVRLFIKNHADVNQKINQGHTPLHFSTRSGDYNTAKLLISAGAQLESKNIFGVTPLHTASFLGHGIIVQLLLLAGADPNTPTTENNETALHIASEKGFVAIIKLLLLASADVNIKTTAGKTAREIALANNHLDAAQLFE